VESNDIRSGDTRLFTQRAERLSPSVGQALVVGFIGVGLLAAGTADRNLTFVLVVFGIQAAFLITAAWRSVLLVASLRPPVGETNNLSLPRYTIIVALFREADVVDQLVRRLIQIDYPPERLECFLVLEREDEETQRACANLNLPSWITVLIAPPEMPRTKPRALNVALARATGEFITVYDAEDEPHPMQLREAAARFAGDRSGTLWALQAPLRIREPAVTASPYLDRQFAVEYASLFEVTLPGLARLGMPFPLGGTSNHFRTSVLRAIGGWDPYNVTEDADLGFRVWREGGRLGVLRSPTFEPPPGGLQHWLPQRTRWLKGYMQTWGVHTREVRGLGWKGGWAMTMTLGVAIAAAAAHAPSLAWLIASVALAMAADLPPETPTFAVSVLATGVLTAWVNAAIGCRRAGLTYTLEDMVTAPAYWSLLSLAFLHAVWRLITEPFVWDKTTHFADVAAPSNLAADQSLAP
jgi:cellulose synthase/poly-beta-1,6-N-acetylglucosamine synthase-like glycosyltransferase